VRYINLKESREVGVEANINNYSKSLSYISIGVASILWGTRALLVEFV
jgi:hypothetical protein